MTVKLELKPDIDSRLRELAAAAGLSVQAYLVKLIESALSPRRNEAAIALLAQWDEEDTTRDSDELERRRSEWEELKTAMNEEHTSDRVLFP